MTPLQQMISETARHKVHTLKPSNPLAPYLYNTLIESSQKSPTPPKPTTFLVGKGGWIPMGPMMVPDAPT